MLVDSPPERWAHVLGGLAEAVQHDGLRPSRMPFVRLSTAGWSSTRGRRMPYGRVGGAWALLHDGRWLYAAAIDADAVCARITAKSGYADRAAWRRIRQSRNSGLDALRACTRRPDRA